MAEDIFYTTEVRKFSNVIGYLPLAIIVAAAFMRENSMSIRSYLELFAKVDLAKQEHKNGAEIETETVTLTSLLRSLHITFDQIRRAHTDTTELIYLASDLDEGPIPRLFFH